MNAFNVRENINPNVEFDEVFNEMIDCLSSYSTPTAMMDEAVRMHYEAEDNLTQNDFEKQQQAIIDRAEKREEDRIQDELNKQEALSEEDYERMRQGFDEQRTRPKQSDTVSNGNKRKPDSRTTDGGQSTDDGRRSEETSQRAGSANAERNNEEIKPIGKGVFGNIYDQFRGKVKEAVDFLLKHKEGDLLGVFHREEIGDIDLIWGSDSENQGLDHIIKKHINKLHDFKDVDEAVTIIEDVINNGEMKPIINNTEKVSFEKDGYKVSVKRKVRDNQGEVIGSKNWVVTAFDTTKTQRQKETETLSEKTLTTPPFNQKADGVTLPSNNVSVSAGKDTTVSENEQEKGEKNDKDTLKEDRSVKNITESESKRKGMLGVVLDALRKAIGKENVITDNEQAQMIIDEQNGIVRPERVAEESKERAERVKNDFDLRRELKEITGAEGYGTNTAYVRGTSQDGTTYEVRVGNHIANFENFDRNNEELPQKIVSVVVMDEKFDKKTARYKSSEEINRELEEKNIDSEFQQIIIDDVKNKSQEEIQQAIEDVLFGMQVLKERGRLLFDSESAISYSKVQKRKYLSNRIEDIFNDVIKGKLKGQPVRIGNLSQEGKRYLEEISGLKLKENCHFVLNPSDLQHIYNNHFGDNEKDKDNNVPLTMHDIKRIADVISFPTEIVYGKDTDGLNKFFFLMESPNGTYNLLEIYANRNGNLTAKSYYKTKKSVSQRVISLRNSLHSTSSTDGATLSSAKIPQIFELPNENNLKLHKVYHGSGADFEAFDHSHMGEGEGNQAYGWGTYVTEAEGIGKTYAGAAAGLKGISYKGMTGEEVYDRADESPELDAASSVINSLLKGMDVESAINEAFKHHSKMGENELAEEIKKLNPNDFAVISDRILYTVEIPDDNGKNYLAWDGYVSNEQYPMWYEAMKILGEQDGFAKPEEVLPFKTGHTRVLIENEVKYLGHKHTPKAVSEALHKAGFTGIKYPAQYRSGGREDGAKNYVIFNEKDLKITDKVQFFKTKEGEAYGFTVGGKVYVDERIADASTPIHEYTHLWAEALRKVNPKEWQNIVGLMKKQTYLWDKVKNDYPELKTDDEIAEEVADKVLSDLLEGVNPNEVKSEEKKIIEKAKADGTYMKAPNGKKSNLNEKQWVQVRTKAFKKWFGDWEKSVRIEKLRKSESITATGNEYKGKYELNNKSADNYIKENLRGEYTNKDTKETIKITRIGAEKVTRHDIESEIHLKSVALIPEMLEKAIFITEETNEKAKRGFDSYKYYVVGLKIDGVDYTAKMVVGVKNGQTYYDHALTEISKEKLLNERDRISTSVYQKEQSFDTNNVKDKRLLSILEENSSKVVDENGEPKVVYHQTSEQFYTFDIDKARKNSDVQAFFFSDGKEEWRDMGKNTMAVFLNIRKITEKPLLNGQDNAGVTAREELQSQGYDGTIEQEEEMETEYAVFNSNQIKSATDNVGTFDGENADIRFHKSTERVVEKATDKALEIASKHI